MSADDVQVGATTGRILIADSDAIVAATLRKFLESEGYSVEVTSTAGDALQMLEDTRTAPARADGFAVIVMDMRLPDMDGMEMLKRLRRSFGEVVPLAVTGFGTIEDAVQAVRLGAMDYLTKPLVDDELRLAIDKAIKQHALTAENAALRSQLDDQYGLDAVVGDDPRMQRIYDVVAAVAPSKTTVLMTGESGTGKSLIARAVHRLSERGNKPFVEISCGSIPETLLESELFGHVKGAFTGAHVDKKGRFVAAHGGTLFLDEINSASPGMQLKLLRVLQERVLEPVGSNEPVEVDVRVILASNQPLEDLVAAGSFRQDLYYRINVVAIDLPPLRERVQDVATLAGHFLQIKAAEAGRQVLGFSEGAMTAMQRYSFPGNVRELENIVERAVVLSREVTIGVADLPPAVTGQAIGTSSAHRDGDLRLAADTYEPRPLREALMEPERQIILAALQANDWNRQQTAEQLDINRTTLYKKIKQFDLERYGEAG